jgi:tight adherence protein C
MSNSVAVGLFCLIFVAVFSIGRKFATGKKAADSKFHPIQDAFGGITEAIAAVIPHSQGKRKRIQIELSDAGLHHRNALRNFLSLRNAALLCWLLLSLIVFVFSKEAGIESQNRFRIFVVAGVISIAIFGVPRILLSALASRRKKKIENSLPDALDMIAMSVEGGLPIERSLNRVAIEMKGTQAALAEELRIIARQSAAGSFEHAIGSFGKRTSIAEVTAWSAIMQNSQRTGGNIVQALREYADRMRSNRRQRIERTASTASVKLLVPVVLFLAPPVFIVLIGPGLLDFRDFILREQENHAQTIRDANLPEFERLASSSSISSSPESPSSQR